MFLTSTNHIRHRLFTTSWRAFATTSSVAVSDSIAVTTQAPHDDVVRQLLSCYGQASRAVLQKKYDDARRICQTAMPLVDNMPDEAIKTNPTLVKAAAMVLFLRARDSMDDFSAEGDQRVLRDYYRLIKVAPDTLERNRLRALLVTEFKMTVEEAYPDLPVSSADAPRVQLNETTSAKSQQPEAGAGTGTSCWSHNSVTLLGSSPKPSRVIMADDETPSRDLSFRASAIS